MTGSPLLVVPVISVNQRARSSHEIGMAEKVVTVFRGYEILIEESGSENGLWARHKNSRLH